MMNPDANRVLLPIGDWEPDKKAMIPALYMLSRLKPRPEITLLNMISIPPSAPLDASHFKDITDKAKSRMNPLAKWLSGQGFKVSIRIALVRDVADGIIEEASKNGCIAVLMQKKSRPDRVLPKCKRMSFVKAFEFFVVALLSMAILRESTTWRVMNSLKTCPVIVTLAGSSCNGGANHE